MNLKGKLVVNCDRDRVVGNVRSGSGCVCYDKNGTILNCDGTITGGITSIEKFLDFRFEKVERCLERDGEFIRTIGFYIRSFIHEEIVRIASIANKQVIDTPLFDNAEQQKFGSIGGRKRYYFKKGNFFICPATIQDAEGEHAIMLLKGEGKRNIYFFNSNAIKDSHEARTYKFLKDKGCIPLSKVSIQGKYPLCSIWTLAATVECLKCENLEQVLEDFESGEMYRRILHRFSAIEDGVDRETSVLSRLTIPTEEIGQQGIKTQHFDKGEEEKFLSQQPSLVREQQPVRRTFFGRTGHQIITSERRQAFSRRNIPGASSIEENSGEDKKLEQQISVGGGFGHKVLKQGHTSLGHVKPEPIESLEQNSPISIVKSFAGIKPVDETSQKQAIEPSFRERIANRQSNMVAKRTKQRD
ncbi:MAG: hypothetical protein LBG48_05840 [Rickettsiales bacterium]|jgi:hypothetical protein|nr:hypothetical protein [Rickettsiales bacterium]